jgi:hypothetical protein
MKPAERMALTDRLARALAWNELTEDTRNSYLRRSRNTVSEIETTDEQMKRIGWMFVEVDGEPEPVE